MSGHNKWSKIKNKKGSEDARRGKIFTKLGRAIAVAVREGGADPDYNPSLKSAIEKAKAENMPNDNIERAIKKASGDGDGSNYEEIIYEGYGPDGIALIVECLTDNRNRTASDVRHYFDKFGGNLGQNGSVSFMFERKGLLVIDGEEIDDEEVMMDAIDAGADDINTDENMIVIYTSMEDFSHVRDSLLEKEYTFEESDLVYVPSNYIKLENPDSIANMEKLIDSLEDSDDVQKVHHNWEQD